MAKKTKKSQKNTRQSLISFCFTAFYYFLKFFFLCFIYICCIYTHYSTCSI